MVNLEFVSSRDIISDSKKVRPDMFRLDFLELKWTSPDNLLELIEDQLLDGNSYDDEGNKFFDATKLVHELVSELKKKDKFLDKDTKEKKW